MSLPVGRYSKKERPAIQFAVTGLFTVGGCHVREARVTPSWQVSAI
jgi:hypothetical protein